MIGFLAFLSKINYTTASFVLCLYFIQVLLIEWRHQYGSCLLTQANISRLSLCLMRIALKLILTKFEVYMLRSVDITNEINIRFVNWRLNVLCIATYTRG